MKEVVKRALEEEIERIDGELKELFSNLSPPTKANIQLLLTIPGIGFFP